MQNTDTQRIKLSILDLFILFLRCMGILPETGVKFLFIVCGCSACMHGYMCTFMTNVCGGQKTLDSELEFQTVVNCHVGARNRTRLLKAVFLWPSM